MKSFFLVLFFMAAGYTGLAQLDNDLKFTKNDYFIFRADSIMPVNDTLKLLTIRLPAGYRVTTEQLGVLYGNPREREDRTVDRIGMGKCRLVKGQTAVFSVKHKKDSLPRVGDLLYTPMYFPAKYKGRVYELIRRAIFIRTATGDSLYTLQTAMQLEPKSEEAVLQKMLDDIQFVAREMKKQNNSQDQLIDGGLFNGKRLFDAMETVTTGQLQAFLDYIIARPRIYVFNCWSISEIFATWMVSQTPTVVKD